MSSTVENEIRALVEAWHTTVTGGDLDRIMAFYDDDVVAFDAIATLQFVGAAAYREHWAQCLQFMGEGSIVLHSVTVQASDDLAVAWFIDRCSGPNEQGEMESGYTRGTACYRRQGDGWRIVHEHFSMPIDMQTGKAIFDAAP